jgi:hypothetical protein
LSDTPAGVALFASVFALADRDFFVTGFLAIWNTPEFSPGTEHRVTILP